MAFFHSVGIVFIFQIWLNNLSRNNLLLERRFCKKINGILSDPQLLLFLFPRRHVFSSHNLMGSFKLFS
jgi:hypothetical protein